MQDSIPLLSPVWQAKYDRFSETCLRVAGWKVSEYGMGNREYETQQSGGGLTLRIFSIWLQEFVMMHWWYSSFPACERQATACTYRFGLLNPLSSDLERHIMNFGRRESNLSC